MAISATSTKQFCQSVTCQCQCQLARSGLLSQVDLRVCNEQNHQLNVYAVLLCDVITLISTCCSKAPFTPGQHVARQHVAFNMLFVACNMLLVRGLPWCKRGLIDT